jgi:hypothetical protein
MYIYRIFVFYSYFFKKSNSLLSDNFPVYSFFACLFYNTQLVVKMFDVQMMSQLLLTVL